MATIEDIERRVEALEMDIPTRKGIVAHLHELDTKFQRLDEGQQRIEHRMERLENKVDDGFQRIEDKFDTVFAYFKINYE